MVTAGVRRLATKQCPDGGFGWFSGAREHSDAHMTALVVGQFIVRNKETVNDLPLEIPLPTPLVSKETGNIDAMLYMSGPKHCLV